MFYLPVHSLGFNTILYDSQVLHSICILSHFSHVRLFATPWTGARQAPLSMGYPRQEYWSGVPCCPPGDPPNPGIKPASSVAPTLQADSSLLLSHCGSPTQYLPLPSFIYRRRQWHPTPVLSLGESHGQRSLVGCSPWGR